MACLLIGLTIPIAMTASAGLYSLVAGIAGSLIGGTDVLTRERARTANAEARLGARSAESEARLAQLDASKTRLAKQEASLVAERAAAQQARLAASQAAAQLQIAAVRADNALAANGKLAARVSSLEAELATKASAMVLYRGEKRLLADAVADATQRAAGRIKTMVTADIGGMAGQAIPYVGVAAIVSGTAYDLKLSCEMLKDLHELDVAFNPDKAIDAREVCGMRVPTVAEVWKQVKNSPGAAWDAVASARPTFYWQEGWDDLTAKASGLVRSVTGP